MGLDPSQSPPSSQAKADERLDSWKEVAVYLKRDVRTVQRWERKEGLPIHRHVHDKKGSVFAFKSELDTWRAQRLLSDPHPGKVILAVLPFESLSSDPTYEYLSDGLTEELITQLAALYPQQIRVMARTTVMQYKGTREPVSEIGRELQVKHVLEGSVRCSGGRARASIQLIRVSDQTHLWADSYEGDLSDPLTFERDVAKAVTEHISRMLGQSTPTGGVLKSMSDP